MSEIILTEEQATLFRQARERLIFRDPSGRMLGVIDPVDAEVIAKFMQRANKPKEPGIPGHKVQAHLQALQVEWDRLGGFDEAYMKEFLAKLRAKDAK